VLSRRKVVLLGSLLWFAGLVTGCDDDRERKCQLAVRSLAAAPEAKAAHEMERVIAFGRYALPDIEQEIHTANVRGRERLLEAISRLRLTEALPLTEYVARWDESAQVRARAGLVSARLRSSTH